MRKNNITLFWLCSSMLLISGCVGGQNSTEGSEAGTSELISGVMVEMGGEMNGTIGEGGGEGGGESGGHEGGAEGGDTAGMNMMECSEGQNLPISLTEDLHLSCGVYFLNHQLSLRNVTLSIAPCTTIKLGPDAGINVNTGAQLLVEGTESCPVLFTSREDEPRKGDWGAISLLAGGRATIDHATLEYGGGDYNIESIIRVLGDAELNLTHSTIKGSSTYGVQAYNKSNIVRMENVKITESEESPLFVHPQHINMLFEMDLAGNGLNEITVLGSELLIQEITESSFWADHGVPYHIYKDLSVSSDSAPVILTIEEGVVIEMSPMTEIRIGSYGGLILAGSEEHPIRLTSDKKSGVERGDWDYLQFRSDSLSNTNAIEYSIFEYGGGDYLEGMIRVEEGADLSMNNSIIRDSLTWGALVKGTLREFSQNQLINNTKAGILIAPNQADQLSEGVYSPNGTEGIFLDQGNVIREVSLVDYGVPYVCTKNITVDGSTTSASLSLEEGVLLKMSPNTSINTKGGGRFLLNGSEERRVNITSYLSQPVPGSWNRIKLQDSGAITWRFADIEYGGDSFEETVWLKNGSLTLNSVTISNGLGDCDIETDRDEMLTIDASSSVRVCP